MLRRLSIGVALVWIGCAPGKEDELAPPSGVSVDEAICLAATLPGGDGDSDRARRAQRIDLAIQARVRAFRWELPWSRIEPQAGELDFSSYDRVVDSLHEAQIDYLGLLSYGNPWASSATSSNDKFPPDDPADFAAYVRAAVSRYRDRVSRWEVWNEQNAGYRFWLPESDPAAYAELLEAASAAAREADPGCTVAYGGTFFAPQGIQGAVDFIEASYRAAPALGESFDAMAFHPYMLYPPAVPPESKQALPPFDYLEQRSLVEMIRDVRAVLAAHGDGDKAIWITELGWPEFETVPADLQAAWLARAYLLALSEGVELICWYTLQDSSGHDAPWEDCFGLVRGDADPLAPPEPERKPAFHALATLAQTLAGMRFDADLTAEAGLGVGAHLLRFAAPDRSRQVLAAWSSAEPVRVELFPSLPGYAFEGAVGLLGEPQPLEAGPSAEIELGPDVIYLLERARD
ncbi:MAG: beta-galactosidase [Deltaproteobacteria bacterium]|nr:beta-galactosidase [Deltaproteobacteria bacterium]